MITLKGNIIGFDQDSIDEVYAIYDEQEEFESMEFDMYEFENLVNAIKTKITTLDKCNNVITEYLAGSNTNLYPLWAFLFKHHNIEMTNAFAVKMKNFFAEVKNIKLGSESENPNARLYYSNSVGAATELPQREQRLAALESELL